jgi:hypothetical protein
MATNPLFIEANAGAPAYNSASYRQGLSALLAGPSAVQIFSGVRGGTVTVVGTAITIAPLSYVLNGGTAPGSEGAYFGAFIAGDADLSKTLTAAHATLDRIDRILVRVYNHDLDGSGLRRQNVEYQVGTAGSGAPTLPTGSVYEIALISVPHSGGGSPSVTMTARPPVAAGGARPGTTAGDLEIYDITTSTWKRVAQTVGAHFEGGYDPGTSSSIANNTWTSMPITNTVTSSRVTLTGGNSLVINEAGLYQCNGSVRLNTGTASGTGRSRFSVNGTEKRQYNSPLTASSLVLPVSCQLRLNVADVLRFEVQQDQGSARLFSNGEIWNYIDIARIS